MTEPSIIDKTIEARADLSRMQSIIEQSFSALCAMCRWNPNEDKLDGPDQETRETNSAPDAASDGTPIQTSESRALVPVSKAVEVPKTNSDIPLEVFSPEVSEVVDDTEDVCKKYAKKIAQLSHPDKLMRFSAKQKVEVLAIFHQSQIDYAARDKAALIYGYIQLLHLRGELHKIDPRLLRYVEQEYQSISRQIRYLLTLPFINAVNAYCEGNIGMAKTLFQQHIINVRQKRKRK